MTANAAPQISINDLENVVRVIDAAAERGAFKGSELTSVGTVRDKVAAFLAAIPSNEEKTEEATTTQAVETPAEEPKTPSRRKAKA
jgi:hypothetical protein